VPDREVDEVPGRAFDRRLLRRLARIVRPQVRRLALAGALFPLGALLELAQPYLVKVAIDEHILRGDPWGLARVAGLFLGVLVSLNALRAVEALLLQHVAHRVMHELRARLFAHVLQQEAAFFDRESVGRLLTRVVHDPEAVGEAVTGGVVAVVGDVLTLAGVLAVMLWMDWRLALVTFALVPALGGSAGWLRGRARAAYREVRRRLARVNGVVQESLQGVAVIQLFGREAHELRAFRGVNRAYRRALFGSTLWEASLYASAEALGSVALALLLWQGARELAAGALTFGTLVAFIQYTNRFFLPIRDLGAKYTVMQAAMASAERIFELMDRRPAVTTPARPLAPPVRVAAPAVAFRGVWFAYAPGQWVLRDCSFEVESGAHVALVGVTGEGKSTCARLLHRAWDVQQGQVLVGGVDVRQWDLSALRRYVGIVFQEPVLFAGPVEASLVLEGPRPARAEDVWRLLEQLGGERWRARLRQLREEGLRERGSNLSLGERQLLALGRALVYNPAVLILDEATSSVDPETDAILRGVVRRLTRGRTALIIAHRLSTVQQADRILVLHRGRIAEAGTHAELLGRGGLYARLWALHAAGGA
jgi:ATP-binding cassette subfamily B protein